MSVFPCQMCLSALLKAERFDRSISADRSVMRVSSDVDFVTPRPCDGDKLVTLPVINFDALYRNPQPALNSGDLSLARKPASRPLVYP